MSFDALAWAAKQSPGSSGSKLVLLGLAECAHRKTNLAFPSLAELVEFTALDRKSVIANLDKLEAAGLITDTGNRVGRTGQIKVYLLALETVPKVEPSQKRNSSDISAKGTENGTRNLSEPLPSEAKASSGGRRKRPRTPDFEVPDWVPSEPWEAFAEMRRRKKKPLDDFTAKQLFGRLKSIRDAGWNVEDVIVKATVHQHDGFWMPDGRDSNVRRIVGKAGERPMNAQQLRSAIAFAEDHNDPERAAELKRQLAATRATGPPGQPIANVVAGVVRTAATRAEQPNFRSNSNA